MYFCNRKGKACQNANTFGECKQTACTQPQEQDVYYFTAQGLKLHDKEIHDKAFQEGYAEGERLAKFADGFVQKTSNLIAEIDEITKSEEHDKEVEGRVAKDILTKWKLVKGDSWEYQKIAIKRIAEEYGVEVKFES